MKRLFSIGHKASKDLKSHGGKWQLPLLILLLLLLPVMAGIQHHYLGKLSEAELVRLKTNLLIAAKNISTDFDNELMKIKQTFRFDEDSSTGLESRLKQTYSTWKQTSAFPGLIKDIYLLSFQNEKPILNIYNIQKGFFSPSDWPAELGKKRYLSTSSEKPAKGIFKNTFFFLPFFPVSNKYPITLSLCNNCQINDSEMDRASLKLIIIIPDSDAVNNIMLSTLMKKHIPVQNDFQLDIAITKGNGPEDVLYISDPDLTITDFNSAEVLTEIRQWDKLSGLFFGVEPAEKAGLFMLTGAGENKLDSPMIRSSVMNEKLPRKLDNIPSLADLFREIRDSPSVPLKLMVKVRNDTLEGIAGKARQRNLLTSYCILAILGVSMVMVYVSARRVDSLARRQLKFIYGVSHELRTPVSVIRSAGENLADGIITDIDQQKQYGRLIRDEGRRLSTMVENILSFSALQNNKTPLNLKAARIIDILEECINTRSGSNDLSKPDIKIESDNNVPLVRADYSSLKIAFNNVIENCIKYSPGDSPILIRIRYASSDNQVIISFEDNGRGIDPEDLPYIFDPFFRGKNTEDQRTPGSGIGLSLVSDIMKKHGGRIEVKSKRHKGTVVSVVLPVQDSIEG